MSLVCVTVETIQIPSMYTYKRTFFSQEEFYISGNLNRGHSFSNSNVKRVQTL